MTATQQAARAAWPAVPMDPSRRDLRISWRYGYAWVVVDKTGRDVYAPAPILFAAPCVDMAYAWLARQRDGAPLGKLVIQKAEGFSSANRKGNWRVVDTGRPGSGSYVTAKTRAAAAACIRVILRNDAPLEGVWS